MKKFTFFSVVVIGILSSVSGCATTVTNPQTATTVDSTTITTTVTDSEARKKRELEERIELDEDCAIISVLTFFKFGNASQNAESADKIEEQVSQNSTLYLRSLQLKI